MFSFAKYCVVQASEEENTESFTLSKIDSSQRKPSPNLFQACYIEKKVAYSGGTSSPLTMTAVYRHHYAPSCTSLDLQLFGFALLLSPVWPYISELKIIPLIFNAHADICCGTREHCHILI